MSKSTISPADEIWALIKETQRNLKQFSAEAEKRQAEAEKQRAEEKGLFLIRATGDNAGLVNKKDFKSKAFN